MSTIMKPEMTPTSRNDALATAESDGNKENSSLSHHAYIHIKQLILSGKLKCGEKISDKILSKALNVSRTPVREALKLLEQYGLIEFKPRSYAKVATISEDAAKCLAMVRIEIEKLAARLLIADNEKLNPDTLTRYVDRSLHHMNNGNIAEAFLNDSAFHLEMARQSNNPTLYEVLERLDSKSHLIRLRSMLIPEAYSQQLHEHLEIIDCLKKRNQKKVLRLLELHINIRFWESEKLN